MDAMVELKTAVQQPGFYDPSGAIQRDLSDKYRKGTSRIGKGYEGCGEPMSDIEDTLLEQKRIELEKLKVAQAISAKRWDSLTRQETLTALVLSVLIVVGFGTVMFSCQKSAEHQKSLLDRGLYIKNMSDGTPFPLPERAK